MSFVQQVSNYLLGQYPVSVVKAPDNSWVQCITSNPAFLPERYDELVLGYTGSNLTSVVYKLLGVTVGTLTLSYTGSNLTGVVRS
jgi:hypothetical protein